MKNKAEPAKKTETSKATSNPSTRKFKTSAASKVAAPTVVKQKNTSKPGRKAAMPKKISASAISRDDIALRAYFISEKRQRQGIQGDSAHDWLEAERQLIA